MCTGIQINSKQNNVFWGRTQEFDDPLPVSGIVIPKGTKLKYLAHEMTAKYAVAGISIDGSSQGVNDVIQIMDGMNECGLTGGSFAFGNNYAIRNTNEEIEAAGKLPIRGEEFVTWALLNCSSVEDLRQKTMTEVATTSEPNMLGTVIDQHYVFVDKTGASIVIEPSVKMGFDIYDNTIGTFTNQPPFPWHVTNLQNYVGLQSDIRPSIKLKGDVEVLSSGKGSGLFNVPGDYTPQGRFVRATALNQLSDVPDDDHAITQLFHILNTTDMPKGTVVTSNEPYKVQYQQYNSVYDLENKTINIVTYENRSIQRFTFTDELKNADHVTRFKINREEQFAEMELI